MEKERKISKKIFLFSIVVILFLFTGCGIKEVKKPLPEKSLKGTTVTPLKTKKEETPAKTRSASINIPIRKEQIPKILYSLDDIPEKWAYPQNIFLDKTLFVILNNQVRRFINFYQTKARKNFSLWLSRSYLCVPVMKRIFKENGIPEDLVYIALIESGFSANAISPKGACGYWQLLKRTARRYGLRVDWWVDERRDLEKSTIAAAHYLKDLHNAFDSWHLAIAGYNAGEGRIIKAIKRTKCKDFWKIVKLRLLKKETKEFVPKVLAAITIAKNPAKYGFLDIKFTKPYKTEKVKAKKPITLRTIAKTLAIPLKTLESLNPALLRGCIPPDDPNYSIKIPKGMGRRFYAFLPKMPKMKIRDIAPYRYVMQKGDNPYIVARRFGVSVKSLIELNRIRNPRRLRPGFVLVLPPREKRKIIKKKIVKKKREGEQIYVVQKGDTLWDISRKFKISISSIQAWNNMGTRKMIKPNDVLRLKIQTNLHKVVREKEDSI
ncbi:MAG: LysM peptidoglycan-binding domain-containing protein [Deltaproteobacteria bacterium]|nr:LysM peptidoglycan-binding domain-containing protein [Deltaproteobacteria bacterium]